MSQYHTVLQGEHLARIAKAYGFSDHLVVWKRPENSALRERRASPEVLLPGDRVFIPDATPRSEPCATGARHTFRVTIARPYVRLALEGALGRPLRSARCTLHIGQETVPVVADAHGIIEHRIPLEIERVDLEIDDDTTMLGKRPIPLFIGHLDPATEVSGQEQRLNNLGYRAGTKGDPAALAFRSAVEEFQCDQALGVDGKCGPLTQKKLVAVHGS